MSRVPATGPGLDEGARFELAMAAAAQEKKNRPLMLVVLSVAVLVVSLVFAMIALGTRNAVLHERLAALHDAQAVDQMASEWDELARQERDRPGLGLGEKMPMLLSRMEELAIQAGMNKKPINPRTKSENRAGITVTEYIYSDVKDTSLGAMMEWLRLAVTIPGMEVVDLRLKPDATGWTLGVTFRRWERAG